MPDSILVVDDAPAIRALVARTLSGLPLRILTAHSVQSAKAALEHADSVRAVVVDMQLPDGNGLEIIEELWRIKPGVPVLLISGSGPGVAEVDFLQKPFDPDDLLNWVKSAASERFAES